MESRTAARSPASSLARSAADTRHMLQEEAQELYEVAEGIPGREWAEWFAAKRSSVSRQKS